MKSLDMRSEKAGDNIFLCDMYLLTYSAVLLRKYEDMILLVLKV